MISIHALLAESDRAAIPLGSHFSNFYPRSPCGERRIPGGGTGGVDAFLSTLSLRRATNSLDDILAGVNISIHALLAESDGVFNLFANPGSTISIHALLAESD